MAGETKGVRPDETPGARVAFEEEREGDDLLLCASCRSPITSPDEAMEVDGLMQHTFVNPGGYIYRIGCFREAPGCSVQGVPTDAFTWFFGHSWVYASCAMCGEHLGWGFFRGKELRFYGLIFDKLVRSG